MDITPAAGTTVPAAAMQQLLFTHDWLTGLRGAAHNTIHEHADYMYRLAYALSGGRGLHSHAHSAALTNALAGAAPGIIAFALHHLRPLLPDLTHEQWERIDAAAIALNYRVCEDLSGATTLPDAELPLSP
ncbi:hypothetical protein [Streptomyces sp. NPDC047014]|uniref:hypothetical protein n=1 Tax=Streptomyces sp. NPDC047014 TaxID=3155736 RepID=UPI0033E3A758